MRKLVILPQLIQDLLFLHLAGGLFLFQTTNGIGGVDHMVVEFLHALVTSAAFRLNGHFRFAKFPQQLLMLLLFGAKFFNRPPVRFDLLFRTGAGFPVALNELLTVLLVTLHLLTQDFQIAQRLFHGLTLSAAGRDSAFLFGNLVTQCAGIPQQLRLTGKAPLRLCLISGGLRLLLRDQSFLFFDGSLIVRHTALNALVLRLHVLKPIPGSGENDIEMVFIACEFEYLLLRLMLLALSDLQLVLRLCQLTFRLFRLFLGGGKFSFQLSSFGNEIL